MPVEGKRAPRFSLIDQDGRNVTLDDLKGAPVVLFFYPQDDTPTCTNEACAFRDAFDDYRGLGARVVGISPDSARSHQKFASKFDLPYLLLADPDHKVCEAYGVWKEKTMFGRTYLGVERTTFVIDGSGRIRRIFARVRVDGHSDAVLDVLRAL